MSIIAVLLAMLALMLYLPRQREVSRSASCQRNLMQIGVALTLYDRAEGALPSIPPLSAEPPRTGGPLKALLAGLVLPDLSELKDPTKRPDPRPGEVPREKYLSGFVCPSDRFDRAASPFPAPVSYRATTGDDEAGSNGGFAPGRIIKLAAIDMGDGLSYTAAFSERLIGPGRFSEYWVVRPEDRIHRIDSGYSWAEPSWRSTLYNHATVPFAGPSTVTAAGTSAQMSASSAHANGVNVLLFDGSVRTIRPTISPPLWRALATTHSAAQESP